MVVDLIRPFTLCRRVFVFLYSSNREKNKNVGGSREVKALSEEPFHIFFFQNTMIRRRISTPYLFYILFNRTLRGKPIEVSFFYQPRLVLALFLLKDMVENFLRFPLLCFLSFRSCSFNVT